MRELGVLTDFMSEQHRRQIEEAAARCGFAPHFYETKEEARKEIANLEVFYAHFCEELLPAAKNLRWFCCSNAGVEPYLKEDVFAREDCLLTNASGAYGVTLAEHLIMSLLLLLRRMPEYQEEIRAHLWTGGRSMRSLCASRITVLGTGDIGTRFAKRARAFEPASITGVNRSGRKPDEAFDRVVSHAQLDEVLPSTEILVLCMPATPETIGILSRERIALLPENAIVANVGRGSAIDQDALIEALNAGKLAGAALDVMTPEPLPPEHPLWETKNVFLTAHVAGDTTLGYTRDRNVAMFCEDLERYVHGEPLRYLVDRKLGY